VQTFMLNKMDFRGCQHCDACKTKTDRCVLKDDMTVVLEAVKNTDVLVLATPIYFAHITAQLKTFVDRCYSYLAPFEHKAMPDASRISDDKKLVLITAQNLTDEAFSEVCEKYRRDRHAYHEIVIKNPEVDIRLETRVLGKSANSFCALTNWIMTRTGLHSRISYKHLSLPM